MKAALVQMKISDDLSENLASLQRLCHQAAEENADLVILPELWNTPFINDRIVFHAAEAGQLEQALSDLARDLHLWIIGGSLPVEENGRLYNRCLVFDDQGHLAAQADKNHLLEVHTERHVYRESDVFTPGESLCTFDSPWGRIALLICFDIRFPEAARLVCQDVFLLAVPAGFNASVGPKHWQPLLQVRAIENEVFVAGVNGAAAQYGPYASYGHSMAIGPDGSILEKMGSEEGLACVQLQPQQCAAIRRRSPYWDLRRLDLYDLEEK